MKTAHRLRHEDLVEDLGRRIVHGELAPGTLLPVEAELGAQHDVSRVVVREAIKLLSDKGLLEARRRAGTRVLPKERWRRLDPDVMAWSASGPPDRELLRALTDVRRVIEPGAARLAATRASDADREALREAFRDMTTAEGVDDAAYIAADLRFHTALLAACASGMLIELTHAIDAAMRVSREVTVARGGHTSLSAHEQVLGAVLARQPEAAEAAMAALIDDAARDIELVLAAADAP